MSPAVVIGLRALNAALAEPAEIPVPPEARGSGDPDVGIDNIDCTCAIVKSIAVAGEPVLLPFKVLAGCAASLALVTAPSAINFV
jgi:hypothetical protein